MPLWSILAGALIFSGLLICKVPMFALKFSHYRFAGNQVRYIFLIAAVVALGIAGLVAVPFIIVALHLDIPDYRVDTSGFKGAKFEYVIFLLPLPLFRRVIARYRCF